MIIIKYFGTSHKGEMGFGNFSGVVVKQRQLL